MKIDENTGLPELPEGYFWRVSDGHNTGSLGVFPGIEVSLMKHDTKLRWFKRVPTVVEVEYRWTPRERLTVGKVSDVIRDLADNVYRLAKDDLPINQEIDAEIAKYAGDYPPKKLGG